MTITPRLACALPRCTPSPIHTLCTHRFRARCTERETRPSVCTASHHSLIATHAASRGRCSAGRASSHGHASNTPPTWPETISTSFGRTPGCRTCPPAWCGTGTWHATARVDSERWRGDGRRAGGRAGAARRAHVDPVVDAKLDAARDGQRLVVGAVVALVGVGVEDGSPHARGALFGRDGDVETGEVGESPLVPVANVHEDGEHARPPCRRAWRVLVVVHLVKLARLVAQHLAAWAGAGDPSAAKLISILPSCGRNAPAEGGGGRVRGKGVGVGGYARACGRRM